MSTTTDTIDLSLEEKRALLAQLLREKASKPNTFRSPLHSSECGFWLRWSRKATSITFQKPSG